MKKHLFISIVIAIIFSFSAVSAGEKDTVVATKTPVTKDVELKYNSARYLSQKDFDSVSSYLFGLNDSALVTMDLLRTAMTFAHDLGLRDGHREYMSMPGFAKRQVYESVVANDAILTAKIDTAKQESSKQTASIYAHINAVKSEVSDVGKVVVEHSSRIGDLEEISYTKEEDGDDTEVKAALVRIKERVAARRLAASN
jgi:hypothetical protein